MPEGDPVEWGGAHLKLRFRCEAATVVDAENLFDGKAAPWACITEPTGPQIIVDPESNPALNVGQLVRRINPDTITGGDFATGSLFTNQTAGAIWPVGQDCEDVADPTKKWVNNTYRYTDPTKNPIITDAVIVTQHPEDYWGIFLTNPSRTGLNDPNIRLRKGVHIVKRWPLTMVRKEAVLNPDGSVAVPAVMYQYCVDVDVERWLVPQLKYDIRERLFGLGSKVAHTSVSRNEGIQVNTLFWDGAESKAIHLSTDPGLEGYEDCTCFHARNSF